MDAPGAIKIYKVVPCRGIHLEEVTSRDAVHVQWTKECANCKPKNELTKESAAPKRPRGRPAGKKKNVDQKTDVTHINGTVSRGFRNKDSADVLRT